MKARVAIVLSAIVSILSMSPPASATFEDWAVGVKAGTLGLGGEVVTDLLPYLNLRGSVQWMDLSLNLDLEDIEYNVDLDFLNPMLVVDWYPFHGSFRLSGGILFNGIEPALSGAPTESVEIGGQTYTPAEVGTLRGELEFGDVAPYVGIGWGNALSHDGRLRLALDLGVAFVGSPDVNLSATGTLASNEEFQRNLAQEEQDIEDDLEPFQFYPVLALSLTYRF